jgi:ribose/xylose/arabinose/galactoside ABC-type transport system permease subunit
MTRLLYLLLTFAAIGAAVWYTGYYQSATPGATYPVTYTYLSMIAAVIFGGLFAASFVNRGKESPNALLGDLK